MQKRIIIKSEREIEKRESCSGWGGGVVTQ
jgi:hypothetical protein